MRRCPHCSRIVTHLHFLVLTSPTGDVHFEYVCASCADAYNAFLAADLHRVIERAS